MQKRIIYTTCILFIFLITEGCQFPAKENPKEILFPERAWNVEKGNDYTDNNSQFSIHRMAETDNLVAFWEAGFGENPATCEDEKFRFDLKDVLNETDKMFCFFRDELKFVEKGNSLTDTYKMLLYLYYNEEGTVYGGGTDEKTGVMWISPGRVKHAPYGAMAHELGHAFQYMVSVDGGWGYTGHPEGSYGQSIYEMTSQYMLWQYYPEWIVFENYHLVTFINNTHKAFLHEDVRYSSPFVLEYWANKHGIDFVGTVWRESRPGEDPVMTYQRLTGLTQEQFNEEMFDAYCRFINWDMERIKQVSAPYANQHITSLLQQQDEWFRIAPEKAPQNYGYNGIRLEVPKAGTQLTLQFRGLKEEPGYRAIQNDLAGWRYGFVASGENGIPVYGEMYSDPGGTIKFTVPEATDYLWLVVMGAPQEHWEHLWDEDESNDEQWPYEFKINGTTVYPSVINR